MHLVIFVEKLQMMRTGRRKELEKLYCRKLLS